ncbi:MAG: hypothetical protein HC915_17555 [Anaerolineae bacterium]|nr:hypothetical protein [Anaerolineae bacterium]
MLFLALGGGALALLSGGGGDDSDDDSPSEEASEQASGGQVTEASSLAPAASTDPAPTATTAPAAPPPVAGTGEGLELSWSGDLLVVQNAGSTPLDLRGMVLQRDGRNFGLADFGATRLSTWAVGMCSAVTTDRNLVVYPPTCLSDTQALEYNNNNGFVWVGSGGAFQVVQNGRTLATCDLSAGRCAVPDVATP